MEFEKIGLKVPEILLPNKNINMTKWAVVACDQYTSEPNYWKQVSNLVSNNPSTLNLIYPEVYLEENNKDKENRINKINSSMKEYLKNKILTKNEAFILVDRKTNQVKSRKGLVVALNLDMYDFNKGSKTLIRATEGTIIERLPPRIKVRENAEIELPHIMVLIDDPKKTVIEPLFKQKLEIAYDFDLMMNSGHIKGSFIKDKKIIEQIANNLSKLANKDDFNKKYNLTNDSVLLYAVGDGNHSLATAKSIWEELKKKGVKNHPAQYALVELVNVHDAGLEFKPIHRVIFNIDTTKILNQMKSFFEKENATVKITTFKTLKLAEKDSLKHTKKEHKIMFVTKNQIGVISIKNPKRNLEVGTLQAFIDEHINKKSIDYIHGEDVVLSHGRKDKNIGFFLPVMAKEELFRTVLLDGALPRKTFSMGDADEKRFYLEARQIK
ncbi:MAG: DUF1015 domain-containing protein [Candidatus Woesearchaeota archaeon]|jgi:hypothetical protein